MIRLIKCDLQQIIFVVCKFIILDWARDAGEDPRVLMSLRIDFEFMG